MLFSLDIVGPAGSDRYAIRFELDGQEHVAGFCGHQQVCSADRLYDHVVPSVKVGTRLRWSLRRNDEAAGVAGGPLDVPAGGVRVELRCRYPASGVVCERIG